MNDKQNEIHQKIESLFKEIKEIHETKPEQAKEKLTIALNLMRLEYKRLKLMLFLIHYVPPEILIIFRAYKALLILIF